MIMRDIIKLILCESTSILSPEEMEEARKKGEREYQEAQRQLESETTTIKHIEEFFKTSDDSFLKTHFETHLETLKNKITYLEKISLEDCVTREIRYAEAVKRREQERKESLNRKLNKEDIINLFVGALEGGSNHWYYIHNVPREVEDSDEPFSVACGEHILNGGYIEFFDVEGEEREEDRLGYVDMDSILEAISIMKKRYPDVWERILAEEDDAGDADAFLQLCVMGEIVFG